MRQSRALKIKGPVRYEPVPVDSAFILRLPNEYTVVLDGLVKKGAAKSRNDLIVEIIRGFVTTIKKEAEAAKDG